jgi:hypothetical protein
VWMKTDNSRVQRVIVPLFEASTHQDLSKVLHMSEGPAPGSCIARLAPSGQQAVYPTWRVGFVLEDVPPVSKRMKPDPEILDASTVFSSERLFCDIDPLPVAPLLERMKRSRSVLI